MYFSFLYQGTLKEWQLIHSEDPTYYCDGCHGNCALLFTLTCHQCLHGLERPHTC